VTVVYGVKESKEKVTASKIRKGNQSNTQSKNNS
jgi:hypothetical protein